MSNNLWQAFDLQQEKEARDKLSLWPLDEYNAKTLNQVHPRNYGQSTIEPHEVYDLIALGAGAGGLVSSEFEEIAFVIVIVIVIDKESIYA